MNLLKPIETGGKARLASGPPIAVIDIGSNSVRLVVYEGATRSPAPLFNEKALCGLGRSVASSGRLEGSAVAQALRALKRFTAISRQLGAEKPWIVATAAVREAANAASFVREAEKICGARVMLLSGKREAELAASGVMSGFFQANGLAGDLGGGSLELIDIGAERVKSSTTLQLGGLRLIQRSGGSMAKARKVVAQDLKTVPWLALGKARPFYAVGGTWRNIAKLHMAATDYPLHVTHGYRISADAAHRFVTRLAREKRAGAFTGSGVSSARKEVLPLGALVLESLIEQCEPSEIIFSVFGIREGLLYSLLPRYERRRDPLLAACEDYAQMRSRSALHARELCAWTDQIFVAPGPAESADERRLRHAACLISDISWRAHPDYRGEQSLNVIAHASLAGLDHLGRIFLALAIYFRHTGGAKNGFSEQLMAAIPKSQLRRARIIGAAIRTAHMLSVGTDGVINRTTLSYQADKLVLALPAALAALDGDRLRRRFEALAQLLDCRPHIRIDKQ